MKNKLTDLNNHLFAQLERLSDEDLTGDDIEREVKRTAAIVDVADQIVENARLHLHAAKLIADHGGYVAKHLPMLGGGATPATPALTVVEGKRA